MTSNDRTVRRREVPAVTRAIGILRQLGKADEPVGVNQMARELGLVPSTCLHILRVLVEEGLVSFDPVSKRYAIDVGILPIARNAIQRNGFASLVESRLTELSLRFGVTGVATQLSDPNHMVVVALSQAPLPFRLQVDLGSRFPSLISATGRCIAAFTDIPEEELKKRFAALHWDHAPSFEEWKSQVAEARTRVFAADRSNYISGVTIIAVPFFDPSGRMTHSLVAIGITDRIEAVGIPVIAETMMQICAEVSGLLFGARPTGPPRPSFPPRGTRNE